MSKKLGISPKSVESRVSVQFELQAKLWDAVPMRPGENLKSWFPRAANALGWSPRRVRAWWNGEARRIDHFEIETLNQRIESAKAAERRHQEHTNAIRKSMETGSGRSPLDGREAHRMGGEMAEGRGVVPRSGE